MQKKENVYVAIDTFKRFIAPNNPRMINKKVIKER